MLTCYITSLSIGFIDNSINFSWRFSIRTLIMNPNSFRFRLIALDEVSMPVGNGQVVGLQRFQFDGNALNGLLRTVFGKQPASRFQIFRFNPFAVRIKRVDAVGNEGLYFTEAV